MNDRIELNLKFYDWSYTFHNGYHECKKKYESLKLCNTRLSTLVLEGLQVAFIVSLISFVSYELSYVAGLMKWKQFQNIIPKWWCLSSAEDLIFGTLHKMFTLSRRIKHVNNFEGNFYNIELKLYMGSNYYLLRT